MSWSGVVWMEPGRLAFRGDLGPAHRHAHAALQVVVVLSGTVRLGGVTLGGGDVAVIPTGSPHGVDEAAGVGLLIYLDPLDTAASALGSGTSLRVDRGVEGIDEQLLELEVATAVHQVLTALTGDDSIPRPLSECHPCLRDAVRLLPDLLDRPVRLADVASAVSLSPSRLGRLFGEQLGLTFPTYLRWVRLRRAGEQLRRGGTLTEAAHAAGFTDSAHLNRVCHEMFGLAPAALSANMRWS